MRRCFFLSVGHVSIDTLSPSFKKRLA